MPDWSIKIVPTGSGTGAAFQPDVPGSNPGDPLSAQQGDLVSWNNTTDQAHQAWQTDANYQPLSDAWVSEHPELGMGDSIPSGRSSSPAYDVSWPSALAPPQTWTIYYFCKLHPTVESERGTIDAEVPPSS
jgi:hypothetical protein